MKSNCTNFANNALDANRPIREQDDRKDTSLAKFKRQNQDEQKSDFIFEFRFGEFAGFSERKTIVSKIIRFKQIADQTGSIEQYRITIHTGLPRCGGRSLTNRSGGGLVLSKAKSFESKEANWVILRSETQ